MKRTERAVVTGAIVGAVAGAAGAYLYTTERGTAWKQQLTQLVDRITADADDVRRLWGQVQTVWARFEEDRHRAPEARRPRFTREDSA